MPSFLPRLHRLWLLPALGACVVLLYLHQQDLLLLLQDLQEESLALSSVIFLCAFAAGTVLLMPNSLLMLAGGALFGLHWGLVINLVGFTLGAAASFLTARHLGKDWVNAFAGKVTGRRLPELRTEGWRLVAILRLIPLIPSVSINYLVGCTRMSLVTFLWASALFTLPNACALTFAGAAGLDYARGESDAALQLAAAVSLLLLLGLAGSLLRRRMRRERHQSLEAANYSPPGRQLEARRAGGGPSGL